MSEVDTIRAHCLKQLVELDPAHTLYFQELEGRIYDWAEQPKTFSHLLGLYYRKYIQLLFNLRLYYVDLLARYTPSELLCLNETDLNPKVRQERQHNEEQHRLYRQILAQGVEDEDDEEEEVEGGNRCRKCKNTKGLSIVLRQLRSADEPSSAFFTCNKCGYQWRVG